ncbi:MAG: hypothetical protein DRJ38_04650, partial [Thermoprotei archaeon]
QLVRKREATATEIAKELNIDVDVVYYHLKILRKSNLLSEPRIVVRGNYIEKYYSIRSDFKEKLLDSIKQLAERERKLSIGEYREIVIALLSVVQSIISGSIRKLKEVDEKIIEDIKARDSIESKIIFCNREKYDELLGKLREITHSSMLDSFDPVEKENVVIIVCIPKID